MRRLGTIERERESEESKWYDNVFWMLVDGRRISQSTHKTRRPNSDHSRHESHRKLQDGAGKSW